MSSHIHDIAIVGGGPVGATLALALARFGLSIALVDARDPSKPKPEDKRNFALVTGSWRILQSLGVADELASSGTPLHGLEAIDGGSHIIGEWSVLFTDDDLNTASPGETLGQMVRADALQSVLDDALSQEEKLERIAPAQFEGLQSGQGHTELQFADHEPIAARLVVGADGLNSTVRQCLGIATLGRDYRKSVFTADVELEQPHNGIARQLFLPEGPLAILPLQGQRANLAWYLKRGAAESLAAEPAAEIEAELNSKLAHFAGNMKIEGTAGAYPLILQLAETIIGERAVLVGDAARRINPLAGQGLNQGFRDVRALIDILPAAARIGEDIGSALVLQRYSAERRFDGTAAGLALDAVDRLFSNDLAITKPIRSLGLFAAQRISPLRRLMARYASATDLPAPRRDLEL